STLIVDASARGSIPTLSLSPFGLVQSAKRRGQKRKTRKTSPVLILIPRLDVCIAEVYLALRLFSGRDTSNGCCRREPCDCRCPPGPRQHRSRRSRSPEKVQHPQA